MRQLRSEETEGITTTTIFCTQLCTTDAIDPSHSRANTEMLNDHYLNIQSRRPVIVQKQFYNESNAGMQDVTSASEQSYMKLKRTNNKPALTHMGHELPSPESPE